MEKRSATDSDGRPDPSGDRPSPPRVFDDGARAHALGDPDSTSGTSTEEALRASEARYRTLVEQVPAVVYQYALDDADVSGEAPHRLAFVSPQIEGVLGIRPEDWIGGGTALWARKLHPEDRERVTAEDMRTHETGDDFREEYRMIGPGGRVVWVRDEAKLLRDEATGDSVWHGVMFDITDLKRVEGALRESEGRYRDLVQLSPDAVLIHADGRFVYANEAAARLLGAAAPADLVGKPVLQIVHPDFHEVVAGRIEQETAGRPVPLIEEKFVRLDGEVIDVEVAGMPFTINGSRGGQIVVRDVTARKKAEVASREAEARYRNLIEQIPAVIYVYEETAPGSGEYGTAYASPQIENMLGYPATAWVEDEGLWLRTLDPRDRDRVLAEDRRTQDEGLPFSMEYRKIASDGRAVWVHEHAALVDVPGERKLWQGVMFDITELKRVEEEVRASMEALSRLTEERRMLLFRLTEVEEEERARLASGIHDDPIQKMTAVGLRLETIRRQLDGMPQQATVKQLEETVRLAIGRLRHLMFELRPPALDRDGLAAALDQYLAQLAEEAELETRLSNRLVTEPEGETPIVAYRIAQEALANVRKHAKAKHVEVTLGQHEGSLVLRVHDDGVGFSPDEALQPRPGHLGLSSIRERAELAGGSLRVDSAPGSGTTVEVTLPDNGRKVSGHGLLSQPSPSPSPSPSPTPSRPDGPPGHSSK